MISHPVHFEQNSASFIFPECMLTKEAYHAVKTKCVLMLEDSCLEMQLSFTCTLSFKLDIIIQKELVSYLSIWINSTPIVWDFD